MEVTFTVPSISCSICSGRIKNELGSLEGIGGVDVDLKSQSVKIMYDPELRQPGEIKNTITGMGYEVIPS